MNLRKKGFNPFIRGKVLKDNVLFVMPPALSYDGKILAVGDTEHDNVFSRRGQNI